MADRKEIGRCKDCESFPTKTAEKERENGGEGAMVICAMEVLAPALGYWGCWYFKEST